MNLTATTFHATKPRHLPFGKLMDGYFELAEHLLIAELAYDVERHIFILESVINQVLSLDALVEQSTNLIHHALVEPPPQT